MKRKLFAIALIILYLALPLAAWAASYTGNKNTLKFHYTSCRWVAQMNAENKVPFDSREKAINAGYVPCKVCRP